MAESRKEPAGGAPAERRRYGLFGFSTAPDAGMDDERRKALARWSGILVAALTVAVVLLMDRLGENLRVILDPYSAQE